MNLPLLRCKYQERYAGYSNPEGVGQFYNTAQRERCSYLYNNNTIISVPQHSLLTIMFFSHYSTLLKMITEKVKKHDYRKAEHKLGYIDKAPYRGYCPLGLIVSTPFRWALFVTNCYNLILDY